MTKTYQIKHDPEVDAVYLRISDRAVAESIELSESVYADLDQSGNPIGIEFHDSNAFFAFMTKYNGTVEIPDSLFAEGRIAS